MGLCKCRVATTLFCFQHRVNVCENCLVKEHEKCVVKTYLAWLQDSDFDASCKLCKESIENGKPVIRLTCHDLFHSDCLDAYAKANFPAHTAPAGYTCPACKTAIVPADNNASPVARLLRDRLRQMTWATVPVAASIQSSSSSHGFADQSMSGGSNETEDLSASIAAALAAATSALAATAPGSSASLNTSAMSPPSTPSRQSDFTGGGGGGGGGGGVGSSGVGGGGGGGVGGGSTAVNSSRRGPAPSVMATPSAVGVDGGLMSRKGAPASAVALNMDADDDKYARRPANAWFARLVGNRIPVRKVQADSSAGLKRAAVVLVLLVIGLITLIEVLTRVRPSGQDDPLLDPEHNPHISFDRDGAGAVG